jgi:hypothetical protein
MSGYYITKKGFVRKCGSPDEPFDTEQFGIENWFAKKMTACEIRDIIREWRPRLFMGI